MKSMDTISHPPCKAIAIGAGAVWKCWKIFFLIRIPQNHVKTNGLVGINMPRTFTQTKFNWKNLSIDIPHDLLSMERLLLLEWLQEENLL